MRLISGRAFPWSLLKAGGLTCIPVMLELAASAASATVPPHRATPSGLVLEGVSAASPMIYDNDWWTDVPDAAYLWAKASAGKCNLRANIVSRDMWGQPGRYQYTLADGMNDCRELLRAARASGLRHIPDPVAGATQALVRPADGRIEGTAFQRSPGSDRIVAEARKASIKQPLLVFCGGPCTTVASAFLTDPSITERMIVFQVDGGAYNGQDGWAWEIVKLRCRFANWARGYFWDKIGTWKPEPFAALPSNPLCNLLKRYAGNDLARANQWGDGAWIYHTFDRRCLTRAADYDGVAITVPQDGTNVARMAGEFLATMKDPSMWHPAEATVSLSSGGSGVSGPRGVAFPLKVSANRRYLLDARNRPFFYQADTPWMLLKLRPEEVDEYLNDRKARGFTALQFMLTGIMGMRTYNGLTPFGRDNDLAHPNEAYFARADAIIKRAAGMGFAIAIVPLWSGNGDGWTGQFSGQWKPLDVSGPKKAREFGRWLGNRYARFKNIMWIMGGDHNPDESFAVICALAAGIHEKAPSQLITVHNAPDNPSAAFYNEQPWLGIDGVYSYRELQGPVYREWSRPKNVRPILLLESGYEHEANEGRPGTPFRVRRQVYAAVLNGALVGTAYGHRDIWRFSDQWRTALADPGAAQVGLAQRFFSGRPWWKLEPDQGDGLVTEGRGKVDADDYVSAARAADGTLVIAYLPTARPVSVDMARLAGRVKAVWYDPTDGSNRAIDGTPLANHGIRQFTPPGRNAAGESDWVLVLEGAKR